MFGLVRHRPVSIDRPDTNGVGKGSRIVNRIPRLRLVPHGREDQHPLRPRSRKDSIQLGHVAREGSSRVDSLRDAYNLGTLVDRIVDSLSNLVKKISGDHSSNGTGIDLQWQDPDPRGQSVGALTSIGLSGSCDQANHLRAVLIAIRAHSTRTSTEVLARQKLADQVGVIQFEPAIDHRNRDTLPLGHLPHL
nr:hypothetical protein [Streptomyces sp. FH025]